MINKTTIVDEIFILLSVIEDYTENGERLHKAKALKWTSERMAVSNSSMNQKGKESLWNQVIENHYVFLDDRGNILGLNDKGLELVKGYRG